MRLVKVDEKSVFGTEESLKESLTTITYDQWFGSIPGDGNKVTGRGLDYSGVVAWNNPRLSFKGFVLEIFELNKSVRVWPGNPIDNNGFLIDKSNVTSVSTDHQLGMDIITLKDKSKIILYWR